MFYRKPFLSFCILYPPVVINRVSEFTRLIAGFLGTSRAWDRRHVMSTHLLEQLIDAFRILPGVGQKTAQRMAYHMLEREREGGQRLADVLSRAIEKIGHCTECRDFSETKICAICANSSRDRHQLCVVESPLIGWRLSKPLATVDYILFCRGACPRWMGSALMNLGWTI